MSKEYVTQTGDMWDGIAFDQMGSTSLTNTLMNANASLHDIFIFPAGVTLEIPDVQIPPPGGMPPWKRVSSG
jgi:phage tail protein X